MKVMLTIFCQLFLFRLFFWSPQVQAQAPEVIGAEKLGDRIALLRTTEPNLYYQVPERWKISEHNVFIVKTADGYELTALLAPSYLWSRELIRSIRKDHPQSIFIPLPRKYTNSQVPMPTLLGTVQAQLSPESQGLGTDYFYLRLTMTPNSYELLKSLTENNSPITGYVTYQFSWEGQTFETIADVVLDLEKSLFESGIPNSSPWIRDQITDSNKNGNCDEGEICAFWSQNTNLVWARFYNPNRLSPANWVMFCADLESKSQTHRTWRLPELAEVNTEKAAGLWVNMRSQFFNNQWWWGTNTLTKAEGDQLYYWTNIDSPNTNPLHRLHNASDRSVCVTED